MNKQKTFHFKRFLQRSLYKPQINVQSRRNYLIALNLLVQEEMHKQLKIDMATNQNKQHTANITQYRNSFLSRNDVRHQSHKVKKANQSASLRKMTCTSMAQPICAFRKSQYVTKTMEKYKKNSEANLQNPFYKIQRSRVRTSQGTRNAVSETRLSIPLDKIVSSSKMPRLQSSSSPKALREKSETVQYQEIKKYYQKKYVSNI